MRSARIPELGLRLVPLLALGLFGCNDDNDTSAPSTVMNLQGKVATIWGEAVVGARVYLVPADQVPTTPIEAADVVDSSAEGHDEPLEDLIDSTAATGFPQAVTDASGGFQLPSIDTTRSYYPFVSVVGAMPADLLPGGSRSRIALTGTALEELDIEVTGQPTAAATYIGSSACLVCHTDFESQKVHAHRLGFRRPGVSTALQDTSRFPTFDAGLAAFKPATSANFKSVGTSLFYHGYDASRGFDKFIVSGTDPGGSEIRAYLWQDTGDANKYKVTMQNLVNVSDPDRTYEVALTYGGAVYKQRYMLKIPNAGYKALYPFLQYQHQGDDTSYERTRRSWRDYQMAYYWNATTKLFQFPGKTQNVESNCMACHVTGYRYFTDATTGERICDGADDQSGDYDLDGDGKPDELNTGCEACHGPGSEHVAAKRPQFIVNPKYLPPEREAMLCGRCHDRALGNDDRQNEQPVDSLGNMARPGVRRSIWLRDFTSRKGPASSDMWADGIHSASHHQQYSDFLKSAHYRNGRRLVVCSDCHDLHGKGDFDGELRANPHKGDLCAPCHAIEIKEHLFEKTGSYKGAASTSCLGCHYLKTAKSGAGVRGQLLGTLTGGASDAEITYFQNDISSHLTTVPNKSHPSVRGKVPGTAMPIPYTNACGVCHDARFIKYQK
jgi:hypothetical protein